ncbi:MAG: glycosyltransferase [Chitinophagales bacterium]
MKVVHINTFPGGGAGIAATRLHEGLLNCNVHSSFVCISDNQVNISNATFLRFKSPTRWQRIVNKFVKPIFAEHLKEHLIAKYNPVCEFLGTPYSDYSIESLPVVREADIINLHWIPSIINYPSFFKNIRKPIVWTMHDLSAFMGCFNYPIEQINNPNMETIDKMYYAKKIEALKEYKNIINIVGPSKWIIEKAKTYQPFAKLQFHHIPYGINTNLLSYKDKTLARKKLGLEEDKYIFLFVSEHIENKRKQFVKILQLAREFLGNDRISFVAIGEGNNTDDSNNITFVGKINSLENLNLYYSAADYFLMPSLEDNFPNVVLEALFCGTPVISNNVGGMKDIINDSNGFLANDFDVKTIYDWINRQLSIKDNYNRQKISEFTKERYAIENMVNAYLKIYNSII